MLTLENLSCSRGNNVLFKNLGFTVGDSCLLVVRGGNGSGKTTLLETIACLRKPCEGSVLYANKNVSGEHFKEYCDIVQYVGHKRAIKMQMTVYENLEFWASLKNNNAAIDAALSFFSLGEYKNTLCAELSRGYQKRVALARLMVTNSEIWLLDEPFVNLDEDGANTLATLISAKCENGGSAIITAHGNLPLKNYSEIHLEEFG